jgi:hypothetical protein
MRKSGGIEAWMSQMQHSLDAHRSPTLAREQICISEFEQLAAFSRE